MPNANVGTFGDWVRTNHSTVINPNGNVLESRDALDHYTSQLLGYNKQFVIGTGKNAKLNQIAFDGYEDYFFNPTAGSNNTPELKDRHFAIDPLTHTLQTIFLHAGLNVNSNNANFGSQTTQEIYNTNDILLTKGIAHTGNYSLGLKPGHFINYTTCAHCASRNEFSGTIKYTDVPYCGCVPSFNLEPGKYVISAWVQVMDHNSRPLFDLSYENYANLIVVETGPASNSTSFNPSGPIVDGWQRVYGEFTVNSPNVKFFLKSLPTSNNSSIGLVLFDDLRIHPFDASFQTFVYDDVSLKLMETLDENNYFTRNEYNQEGKIERVKRETERGVMMINESRYGNQKTH